MQSSLFLGVVIIAFFGMMIWQSKKAKEQQQERKDFRANLQPGTEVTTIRSSAKSLRSTINTTRSSSIPRAPRCVSH